MECQWRQDKEKIKSPEDISGKQKILWKNLNGIHKIFFSVLLQEGLWKDMIFFNHPYFLHAKDSKQG